jgi:hypothetical protein
MREDEARALVERVRNGEKLSIAWDSGLASCVGDVRYEKGRGFVAHLFAQPYEDLPLEEREEIWSERELLVFFQEKQDPNADLGINWRIAIGQLYRTRCVLQVSVRDYDSGVEIEEWPAGSAFQAWKPLTMNATEVPVTPGAGSKCFDWGVTSSQGRFISYSDFLKHCELVIAPLLP